MSEPRARKWITVAGNDVLIHGTDGDGQPDPDDWFQVHYRGLSPDDAEHVAAGLELILDGIIEYELSCDPPE